MAYHLGEPSLRQVREGAAEVRHNAEPFANERTCNCVLTYLALAPTEGIEMPDTGADDSCFYLILYYCVWGGVMALRQRRRLFLRLL